MSGAPTPAQVMALEEAHYSGGVPRRPLVVSRAQGARIWSAEGREYIDCWSAQGWANVGHSHPAVTQAIQAQAETLVAWTEASYTEQRALWMRDLAALTPGSLNRIHPCNSGAEAVEGALKAARFFTGRTQIVAARRGFHGRTFGAMTATWNKQYSGPFKPLVPDFSHIPYNDIHAATAAITEQTAAVLVEVIQGEGGVHPGDPAYFEALRHHCNQTGTLLIFDEVQTGFGRTGKMFATEHLSILPDVMTLGKSLGGGLPMGAVVWREELGKLDALTHGSTFGGNPLACAASRAMMQVLQDEALPARTAELGAWFMAELNALNARRVREVRGRGLMIGLELRTRVTPVLKALSDAGVWAIPAGSMVLRLLPPLIIPRSDLERVLEVLGEVL